MGVLETLQNCQKLMNINIIFSFGLLAMFAEEVAPT